MTRIFFSFIFVFVFSVNNIFACTTAVVSGKYTEDGRPILWKHRDSDFDQNKLMYFTDGKYNYIGLVNSEDFEGKEIWAGTNSAGFSIMNAALYDVNLEYEGDYKDREGFVMKMALQQCATLEDFEKFLNDLPKPMGVAANFGVIDANGGAAYYETDNNKFVKFDANDTRVAPNGYLIRTNHAFTGEKDKGKGYIRYENAYDLFSNAFATNKLNYQTIITEFSRSFYHSLLKTDYREQLENYSEGQHFINAGDLIVRNSSVADVIVHGVKKGESPEFTTMWAILGYPFTTVAVPVWIKGGKNLPRILMAEKSGNALLCDMSLKLKKQCYPIERGSGSKYLNISAVINKNNTGILQKIEPVEKIIFIKTEEKISDWRINLLKENDVQEFYHWIDDFITKEYKKNFF
ncbi:carcinine hydrolase/isopenicillin-N N-acyltransferase family protein [Bacteroidota bacterium]